MWDGAALNPNIFTMRTLHFPSAWMGLLADFSPPNPNRIKQLLLLIISVLYPFLVQGQTADFLDEYKGFFKDLPTHTGRLYEATFPQMDPWRFSGGMGDDTLDASRSLELLRIAQCWDPNNQQPYATAFQDSLIQAYLLQGILPLWILDMTYDRLGTDTAVLQKLKLSDSGSSLWAEEPLSRKELLFAAVPASSNLPSSLHSVVIDDRLMLRWGVNTQDSNFILIQGTQERALRYRQAVPLEPGHAADWHFALALQLNQSDDRYSFQSNPWLWGSMQFRLLTQGLLRKVKIPMVDWRDKLKDSTLTQEQWSWFVGPKGQEVQHGAQISIHRSNGSNACLQKPLIVVEGIDFGYADQWSGFRDGKCGSMGYVDLLHGRLWNAELQHWEAWPAIEAAPEALNRFRRAGYDIIYVDFWDGAQDMHLNAEILERVFLKLRDDYCLGPMHVLGASMGGVLAQRALRNLENRGDYLCVASLTAFDSPFLGANIPAALQAFVSYYQGILPGCHDAVERQLNRPAARQLLALHHDAEMNPHADRLQWMREDSLLGFFPSQPWLFGISSGSWEGRGGRQLKDSFSLLNPGDLMATVHTVNHWKQGIIEAVGPDNKWVKWLLAAIPEAHATLFANGLELEDSQPRQNLVAQLQFTYKKRQIRTAPRQVPSLDHLAGGFHSGMSTLSVNKLLAQVFVQSQVLQPHTCFVPKASAWSLSNINQEVYTDPINRSSNPASPFHRVFAPAINQEHCFFDTSANGNVAWLLVQLNSIEWSPDQVEDTLVVDPAKYRFLSTMHVDSGTYLKLESLSQPLANAQYDSLSKTQVALNAVTGPCPFQRIEVWGRLELGKAEMATLNVHLSQGAVLHVHPGGQLLVTESNLLVHSGSQLVLDSGSLLSLSSGAKLHAMKGSQWDIGQQVLIQAHGPESRIILDGLVRLQGGADWSPELHNGAQVHLRNDSTLNQAFELRASAANSRLIMDQADGEWQVVGDVRIPGKRGLGTWPIQAVMGSTKVYFHPHATLRVGNLDSAIGTGFWGAQGLSDSTSGLAISQGKARLVSCSFVGLGCSLFGQAELEQLTLKNCAFRDNFLGLEHHGADLFLEACTIENNRNGVEVLDAWGELLLQNCTFVSNEFTGFCVNNSKPNARPCLLVSNRFYANKTGVKLVYQPSVIACNTFVENQIGAEVARSWISLSGTKSAWSALLSKTVAGGANTFFANARHALLIQQVKPFLDGYNNFVQKQSCGTCGALLGGIVDMDMSQPYWVNQGEKFNLGANYFQPVQSQIQDLVQIGYYSAQGNFAALDLQGDRQSLLNGTCYSKMEWVKMRQSMQEEPGTELDPGAYLLIREGFVEPRSGFEVETIYSLSGQVVWRQSNAPVQWPIALAPGVYIMHGRAENRHLRYKVIVP